MQFVCTHVAFYEHLTEQYKAYVYVVMRANLIKSVLSSLLFRRSSEAQE